MPTDTATPEEILTVVTDAFVTFGVEREHVTREASFEQLDIDSLDLAELAQIVDERFAVRLVADDVKRVDNVGALVDLIGSRA